MGANTGMYALTYFAAIHGSDRATRTAFPEGNILCKSSKYINNNEKGSVKSIFMCIPEKSTLQKLTTSRMFNEYLNHFSA